MVISIIRKDLRLVLSVFHVHLVGIAQELLRMNLQGNVLLDITALEDLQLLLRSMLQRGITVYLDIKLKYPVLQVYGQKMTMLQFVMHAQ